MTRNQRFEAIEQRAERVIGPEAMTWLRAPSRVLEGISPIERIARGRADLIDDLLTNIESGQPT